PRGAGHQRRRDLAHGAAHPLRDRHRHRAGQALQPAQPARAAACRADLAGRAAFTDPELLRSSLANVILRMLALKLGEVDEFPFLEAPDPRVIADGFRRLTEISAIDEARRLTAIGRTLARLPIDVQLARMLVEGEKLHALRELLVIVAFLSIQDPRERPGDARQQADAAHAVFADPKSDFIGVLNLWRAYHDAHEELTQS